MNNFIVLDRSYYCINGFDLIYFRISQTGQGETHPLDRKHAIDPKFYQLTLKDT